jgi:hypothetical protein
MANAIDYAYEVELSLRVRAGCEPGSWYAQIGVPVLQYEVMGLPSTRKVWISPIISDKQWRGRWQILPLTVFKASEGQKETWVKGKWMGDFDSPEAALASLNEAFLQDAHIWHDYEE